MKLFIFLLLCAAVRECAGFFNLRTQYESFLATHESISDNTRKSTPSRDAIRETHADEQEPEEVLEDSESTLKKDYKRTASHVRQVDPHEMLNKDINLIKRIFMPGKAPDFGWDRQAELLLVFVSIAWLAVYKLFIFANDRSQDHTHWGLVDTREIEKELIEGTTLSNIVPDMVLVFHKPDHEYKCKNKPLSAGAFRQILNSTAKHKKLGKAASFARCHKLLDTLARERTGSRNSITEAMWGKSEETPRDEPSTTLGDARIALLQDLYEEMPRRGFEMQVYSSIDDDELHVCITLNKEEAVSRLVQGLGMRLQVQKAVVQQLDILQNPDDVESSPPYLEYTMDLGKNVLGQGSTDYDFWEVFGKHKGKGTILSGSQRIQCIYQHMARHFNLDYALQSGALLQWWPAHNPVRIHQLKHTWANWRLMADFTIRQPVTTLNDYFGPRIAFMFAWNGLYAKCLLALIPMVLPFEILDHLVAVDPNHNWHQGDGGVLGLGLTIALWAKVSLNWWLREQEYLKLLWDLDNINKLISLRSDFQGTLMPSEINAREQELYYPQWKYCLRMAISYFITFLFCVFVFFVILVWLDSFDGRLNIFASMIQALLIQVFTIIFNALVVKLNAAENHKFEDAYYNSFLRKQFVFQFVNQYSAFLFMAVKQQFTERGCPDNDCVAAIRNTMPLTLLSLAALQIANLMLAVFKVKIALWWESRSLEHAPEYSFVEIQGKMQPFRIKEQIEAMTQLVLTLGYVLIFGAVAPWIIPLCFMVFVVQLRAQAVLLTTAANRSVPRIVLGLGPWIDIIKLLMQIGVGFTAYLLVQFGPNFVGCATLTKLTGFAMFCALVMIFWVMVNGAAPPNSYAADILSGRRQHVKKEIMQVNEDTFFDRLAQAEQQASGEGESEFQAAELQSRTEQNRTLRRGETGLSMYEGDAGYSDLILNGEWSEIPKNHQAEMKSFYVPMSGD
jgi:hypothetical protein